jgi:cyclophilin family peptidyl-prolyl cis-trans isomerase
MLTKRGLLAGGLLSFAATTASAAGVVATLSLEQEFVYAGAPIMARVHVTNETDTRVRNPLHGALRDGFEVRAVEGSPLTPASPARKDQEVRPERLDPGASDEAAIDLGPLFPGLGRPGKYEVHWVAGKREQPSPARTVTVLPAFDASHAYTARLETDLGVIEAQLFPTQSPVAVKAFVDLANAGVYDGLPFEAGGGDGYVVGGDVPDDPARPAVHYPAELSAVVVLPGTIVMKPVGAAPPANGPAFIIALEPRPEWLGQVTVVGQVLRGMEVAGRISRTAGARQAGATRAAPEARLIRVTVTDQGAATGAP